MAPDTGPPVTLGFDELLGMTDGAVFFVEVGSAGRYSTTAWTLSHAR